MLKTQLVVQRFVFKNLFVLWSKESAHGMSLGHK